VAPKSRRALPVAACAGGGAAPTRGRRPGPPGGAPRGPTGEPRVRSGAPPPNPPARRCSPPPVRPRGSSRVCAVETALEGVGELAGPKQATECRGERGDPAVRASACEQGSEEQARGTATIVASEGRVAAQATDSTTGAVEAERNDHPTRQLRRRPRRMTAFAASEARAAHSRCPPIATERSDCRRQCDRVVGWMTPCELAETAAVQQPAAPDEHSGARPVGCAARHGAARPARRGRRARTG